jgi:hypothetical protein
LRVAEDGANRIRRPAIARRVEAEVQLAILAHARHAQTGRGADPDALLLILVQIMHAVVAQAVARRVMAVMLELAGGRIKRSKPFSVPAHRLPRLSCSNA